MVSRGSNASRASRGSSIRFNFRNVTPLPDVDENFDAQAAELAKIDDFTHDIYKEFDLDGGGEIEIDEFEAGCRRLGLFFSAAELQQVFMQADSKGNGHLTYDDFIAAVQTLRHHRQSLVVQGQYLEDRRDVSLSDMSKKKFVAQMKFLDQHFSHDTTTSAAQNRVHNRQVLAFKKRLRFIFENIDTDGGGTIDFTEFSQGMLAIGVHLGDDVLAHMFDKLDEDGSGGVDYEEFETAFSELFLGKNKAQPGHWTHKIKTELDSRLRPPPPPRPDFLANRIGSVKLPHECNASEAIMQNKGRQQLEDSLVSHGSECSVAVLRIRCKNAHAAMDITGSHTVPPFPSRPIALLNVSAPDTGLWFEAAHSDWLNDEAKPFELPIHMDYFDKLKRLEVCMLDLENGSGTAKLQVSIMWTPKGKGLQREHIAVSGFEGRLLVRVIRAKQLPKMDVLGLTDPYVIVIVGNKKPIGKKNRTSTKIATLDPVWDEVFEFKVAPGDVMARFMVFDWDATPTLPGMPSSDDPIGFVDIRLDSVCQTVNQGNWQSDWFHIRNENGSFVWGEQVAGEEHANDVASVGSMGSELHRNQSLQSLNRSESFNSGRLPKKVSTSGKILKSVKDFFVGQAKKSIIIETEDCRDQEITADKSVGFVQITKADIQKAVQLANFQNRTKKRFQEAYAHRDGATKAREAVNGALGSKSKRDIFNQWRGLILREKSVKYLLMGNSDERYASLQISAEEEVFGGNVGIRMKLEFSDIPRMDFFGQADPFYKIEVPTGRGTYRVVATSEPMEKTLNPIFPMLSMVGKKIFQDNNPNNPLRIKLFDWDLFGKDELIGYIDTTLTELEAYSRSGHAFYLKDAKRKRPDFTSGKMYPRHMVFWNEPIRTVWKVNLDLEVHAWKGGDAYAAPASKLASKIAYEQVTTAAKRMENMVPPGLPPSKAQLAAAGE